jgi:uncharacterized membrane protein YbhN (UPF0104 family)
MKRRLYTVLRWVFFAASLLFLARFASETLSSPDVKRWLGDRTFGALALAIALYSMTVLPFALGWRTILSAAGYPVRLRAAAAAMCLTQIAKYLPGNVGHHAGRVALGTTRLGVPARVGVASLVVESVLVIFAAMLVGTGALLLSPEWFAAGGVTGSQAALAVAVAAGGGVLAFAAAPRLRHLHAIARFPAAQWLLSIVPAPSVALRAVPAYVVIYVLNGVAVLAIATALGVARPNDLIPLTAAYSLAWIVGFLLPGAPGGLGVREAAFVMLLGASYGPDASLGIALLSRIGTAGADVLLFVVGFILSRTGALRTTDTSTDPT